MNVRIRYAFPMIVAFLSAIPASARNWDALGVFWKVDKVVISITEPRPNTWPGPRLQTFLDAVGAGARWEFERRTGDAFFTCGRDENSARCTFRFLPGLAVEIEPRFVKVRVPLEELRASGWDVREGLAPLDFESSNGDRLTLEIASGELRIFATKR